ncbi:MAG: hypothetical protein K8S99_11150 [Planctomycetes bacterium]|nr:hypothetical protein [Planctomycetota bacterium]
MEFRAWLDKNSAMVTIVAVMALLVSLVYIFMYSRGGEVTPGPRMQYFFDLGAKVNNPLDALFPALDSEVPPIRGAISGAKMPDGSEAGVGAQVFACGSCADKSKLFIAYIEKYTPEARAKKLNPQHEEVGPSLGPDMGPNFLAMDQGHLVSTAEDRGAHWIEFMSPEGQRLRMMVNEKCPKGDLVRCMPGGDEAGVTESH